MNKTAALFIVLGVLTAAALMMLLKPEDASAPPLPPPVEPKVEAVSAVSAPEIPLPPAAPTYEWKIAKGQRLSGPETVQAQEGENLSLRFTSDQADELHLHGYDMRLSLKPGEQGVMTLQASHSGRFEIELHHSQLVVTVLEVLPRAQ